MSIIDQLRGEVERLKAAIRQHRDQRGDDRCWLDDARLYEVLGEGQALTGLPPKCEFLESCSRFWEQRQNPGVKGLGGGLTIAQLEAENERLRKAVLSVQEIAAPPGTGGDDENNDRKVDEPDRLADAPDAAWDGGELAPESIDDFIKDFRSRHPHSP